VAGVWQSKGNYAAMEPHNCWEPSRDELRRFAREQSLLAMEPVMSRCEWLSVHSCHISE
jgi:hypothetical protein